MSAKPSRPVTSDEVTAFARDGAVLIKNILSPEWVDRLQEGIEAAIAAPDHMSGLAGAELRVDQFPASHCAKLRRMMDESPIAEIVGTALQMPVRFYMDQGFYKSGDTIAPTPWHQDTCYYNIDGHDLIRAWVSPNKIPRNASLEVVRGSHLWNVTYRPLAGRDPELDAEARAMLEAADPEKPMIGVEAYEQWTYWTGVRDTNLPAVPDIAGHRDSYDILGWDYEPGDVILFHGNILHAALGDVPIRQPRWAHASLWAGPDVRYLHRPGQILPDPEALYAHKPRTGQLISEFPDVFPLGWSP